MISTQLCWRVLGSCNSVCPSVRLSVRHTRALRLIQRTYRRYFYTTWKGNPSSFLPPNSGWWATSLSTQNGRWKWPTHLWKSLTSTDNNEFTRWHHSARFWRHHNYISYLLWRWPLLSFRVGFSYIVRIICDGLCTLSKYRFWILIVCWLLPLYKTPSFSSPIGTKIGDLLQYMTIGQLSFPLVSSVSALFYAERILHSASLLRLSVRASVCPSVGLS